MKPIFGLVLLILSSYIRGRLTLQKAGELMPSCEKDGPWRRTPIGTNATRRDEDNCSLNLAVATRRCGFDQKWNDVYCLVVFPLNDTLNQVLDSPAEGLHSLSELILSNKSNSWFEEIVFLFNIVLQSEQALGQFASSEFIQELLDVALNLLSLINEELPDLDSKRLRVTQLLMALNDFALTQVDPSDKTITIENQIFLKVLELNQSLSNNTVNIDLFGNSIMLPPELLGQEAVRIALFLYQNLSSLLPPQDARSRLVSSVVLSTVKCKSYPCIDHNYTVTFKVYAGDTLKGLSNQSQKGISCASFQFQLSETYQSSIDWTTTGCSTELNGDHVICSCNHAPCVAVLLSPMDDNDEDDVEDAIETKVGLILTATSLLCLVVIILTYSLMKSLWNIRNYVHIMLCVSLLMAHTVFVGGVDIPEKDMVKHVCSAIAVLLQYLFHVSFMWMLMEGVVLYVTLVKVFVHNHKYYMIGFTVASYGIPALYLAITVPIGFLVGVDNMSGRTHYLLYIGEEIEACFINYGWFYVLFVFPAAVAILANIGFIIMVIKIILRQRRRNEINSITNTTKYWLKTGIALTVVMGTTWVVNFAAFLEELLNREIFLNIVLLAAQNFLLFIVLIPLSREVREAYLRLWRKIMNVFLQFKTNSTSSQEQE